MLKKLGKLKIIKKIEIIVRINMEKRAWRIQPWFDDDEDDFVVLHSSSIIGDPKKTDVEMLDVSTSVPRVPVKKLPFSKRFMRVFLSEYEIGNLKKRVLV
jgi:hypothetical protein